MLKITAIETPSCVYLSLKGTEFYYHRINEFLYDGKKPETTHHIEWIKVDKIPTKISHFEIIPGIRTWILKDVSLQSDKIPKTLIDVLDYEGEWKEEYSHLQSLYTPLQSNNEQKEIFDEFEIVQKLKINEEIDFVGLKIPAITKFDFKEKIYIVTEKDLKYSLLDEITIPTLLLHKRPCKISSKQSYDIVRQYVKENIDSKYAAITSDYDFCFTVKKKIELFTPEKYKLDVSPIKARKPRYETRYRKAREYEIFEMTYSPENYKGYTPIKEFEGEDLKDLKDNIEVFCKNLIDKINEPLKDCPHCKGYGVILDSEIKQSE